jgi:hypothetical protein
MAVLGALARLLNRHENALKVGLVLSDLFVAGFTGLLLFWITRDLQTEAGWVYALSGVAGWIGPKVIDKLMEFISQKTGIEILGNSNKDEN